MNDDFSGMTDNEIAELQQLREEELLENEIALKDLKKLKEHISWMESELQFLKHSPELASTIRFVIVGHLHAFSSDWYSRWRKEREERNERLGYNKKRRKRAVTA